MHLVPDRIRDTSYFGCKKTVFAVKRCEKYPDEFRQSRFLESMRIVTGPSLINATFMSAPNSPV